MQKLTWPRIAAWRVQRHHLNERAPAGSMFAIASRLCGLHAQVLSSALLTLWARVEGLKRDAVQRALWEDRTLVKTWAMRGTLHLLSASELPLYAAARDWQHTTSWSNYFAEFGLTTSAQQEAFLTAIPHVLEQGPLTRQQLADA